MTETIKTDLEGVKETLNNLEGNLDEQLKTLKEREEKWKKLDEEALNVTKSKNNIVKFNVSGEQFATKTETLLNVKDTLFYKIVMSKKFDLSKEIFIDRSSRLFPVIMNYLRNGKINYNRLSNDELEELKQEADYYELVEIVTFLDERLKEPVIINFTFSGVYNSGGNVIGSNKLEDINDRNLTTGICANSPGWIVFELNHEFDFSNIEVGGYTGNTTYWGPTNGSGASILTSRDNVNFTHVGTIPSTFSNNITQITVNKSTAKYIKLNHNSYLGVGYFKIIKDI